MAAAPLPQGLVPPHLLSRVTSSDPAEAQAAAGELFAQYVEPLCDAFSADAAARYNALFLAVIDHCRTLPAFAPFDEALRQFGLVTSVGLAARHEQLKAPLTAAAPPRRIYFLSRVTIGADVAVTSVFLRYFRERYPDAELVLAGSRKLAELYAGDAALRHLQAPYIRRGPLASRLASWVELRDALAADAHDLDPPEWAVVDPDSRLTQLGLLPVTPEPSQHWFFPSREVGQGSGANLATLAREWLFDRFGSVESEPRPYVSPVGDVRRGVAERLLEVPRPIAAVNFGTGGNNKKGAGPKWEAAVIRALGETGYTPILDAGFGDAERQRAAAVLDAAKVRGGQLFQGTIAELAALTEHAGVYVGYDSAGAHLAAAAGVPCVDVFYNPLSPRHRDRWTPESAAPVNVVTIHSGGGIEKVVQALP